MKIKSKNDLTDILVGEERYGSQNYRGTVVLHHRKALDPRAEFARNMIQAWGVVAARPAIGMEPQDKREITLMPVKEVVQRACDMASLAFEEFGDRGWLLDIPSLDEINTPDDPTP